MAIAITDTRTIVKTAIIACDDGAVPVQHDDKVWRSECPTCNHTFKAHRAKIVRTTHNAHLPCSGLAPANETPMIVPTRRKRARKEAESTTQFECGAQAGDHSTQCWDTGTKEREGKWRVTCGCGWQSEVVGRLWIAEKALREHRTKIQLTVKPEDTNAKPPKRRLRKLGAAKKATKQLKQDGTKATKQRTIKPIDYAAMTAEVPADEADLERLLNNRTSAASRSRKRERELAVEGATAELILQAQDATLFWEGEVARLQSLRS